MSKTLADAILDVSRLMGFGFETIKNTHWRKDKKNDHVLFVKMDQSLGNAT